MIQYATNQTISSDQFISLLRRSSLAERRPVDDLECIAQMLHNADLLITAWNGETLIGVARSVTDYGYCCYLSDLAVDREYQRQGIGKVLIHLTQRQLGPRCKLILLSAPAAVKYYPKIGFESHPSAWVLPRGRVVK